MPPHHDPHIPANRAALDSVAPFPSHSAMKKPFAELFCSRHRVSPELYRNAMLRRCLYPRALLLRPLLLLFRKGHFDADYELISRVGGLTNHESLHDEIDAFHDPFANRGFLRRTLRLRVSARRVQRQFESLMPRAAPPARKAPVDDGRSPAASDGGSCEQAS
jgi:hypothetical protein